MKATLHTDGGARGNPGPAAFAYVLEAGDGTLLAAHGETIGVATNNVAEYRALVEGLRKAAELHVGELEVVSDSELVVHQMRGEWKIKKDTLRALWEEASDQAALIGIINWLQMLGVEVREVRQIAATGVDAGAEHIAGHR